MGRCAATPEPPKRSRYGNGRGAQTCSPALTGISVQLKMASVRAETTTLSQDSAEPAEHPLGSLPPVIASLTARHPSRQHERARLPSKGIVPRPPQLLLLLGERPGHLDRLIVSSMAGIPS
jgi:hypothetical protein